jgi:hypothetical protein
MLVTGRLSDDFEGVGFEGTRSVLPIILDIHPETVDFRFSFFSFFVCFVVSWGAFAFFSGPTIALCALSFTDNGLTMPVVK